jgi:hypothetical protein
MRGFVISTIESNIMRVAVHVACAGRMRKAQDCNIFTVNPERKRPFEVSGRRCEDNVK